MVLDDQNKWKKDKFDSRFILFFALGIAVKILCCQAKIVTKSPPEGNIQNKKGLLKAVLYELEKK